MGKVLKKIEHMQNNMATRMSDSPFGPHIQYIQSFLLRHPARFIIRHNQTVALDKFIKEMQSIEERQELKWLTLPTDYKIPDSAHFIKSFLLTITMFFIEQSFFLQE